MGASLTSSWDSRCPSIPDHLTTIPALDDALQLHSLASLSRQLPLWPILSDCDSDPTTAGSDRGSDPTPLGGDRGSDCGYHR